MKVLIADDDAKLCARLRDFLVFEHYTVDMANNGSEALQKLTESFYDLVILDWNMPEISGLEVCRAYRARGGNIPVLFLTARSDVLEKLSGFDAGADDYLTKPFELIELSARVKALLRRPPQMVSSVFTVGNVTLDSSQCSVFVDAEPVKLLPSEFRLLEFLMKNPDKVFGGNQLFRKLWEDEEYSDDAVRTCIKSLRKKLGADGGNSIIKTVHGLGYKVSAND